MTINKLNYEVYAIDYLDGNLSEDLQVEMEQFLVANPDIADEVGMFDSMVLVADSNVEFLGKAELKQPIKFTISNYMNWIVPICMSLAFMAVYPYIHQYRLTDTELQQDTKPTEQFTSPKETISTAQSSEKVEASLLNVSPTNLTVTKKQVTVYSPFTKTLVNRNNAVASYNVTDRVNENLDLVAQNIRWDEDEEEKSTVDISSKRLRQHFNEELRFLASYPNVLTTENQLKKRKVKWDFNTVRLSKPYLTFSVTPLSVGYDIAKTTNIESQELIRDLPVNSNSHLVLHKPMQFGVGMQVHLSEDFAIETGYYATQRQISYLPFVSVGEPVMETGIRYITNTIPVNASLSLPFVQGKDDLKVKVGAAANWMGSRNYTQHNAGNLDVEPNKTATLVRTPSVKLVTTDDELQISPSLMFGVEYEKDIDYGKIAFAVTYNRQMNGVNRIRVWDYDAAADARGENLETFNMRFETVTASVKYTLPHKWYLNKN